jgi:hypothetical protein
LGGGSLSPGRLLKEMRDVAGSLIRCEEGDDDLARLAALASQPVFELDQWEGIAEMLAQFLERESGGVFALSAIRAVVVRVVDVREGCGF